MSVDDDFYETFIHSMIQLVTTKLLEALPSKEGESKKEAIVAVVVEMVRLKTYCTYIKK